jgi:hypothetical protein
LLFAGYADALNFQHFFSGDYRPNYALRKPSMRVDATAAAKNISARHDDQNVRPHPLRNCTATFSMLLEPTTNLYYTCSYIDNDVLNI